MQRREWLKKGLSMVALSSVSPLLWATQNKDNNSLWGRVWNTHKQVWLNSVQLQALVAVAPAVIIGERHDNPQHQHIERVIIDTLAQMNKLGGVAMEMLDNKQQALINAQPNSYWRALDDSQLQSALMWQTGWDWQVYGSIIKRIFELNKPLIEANLVTDEVRTLVRANLAPQLPKVIQDFQQRAIVEGHCGLLPDHMIDGMLAVQVARDRKMAEALETLPNTGVLICGAGHARLDVGVGQYMTIKPLSIGLIEVPNPLTPLAQAQPKSVDSKPVFDLLWFTSAHERDDPCASLRTQFADKI